MEHIICKWLFSSNSTWWPMSKLIDKRNFENHSKLGGRTCWKISWTKKYLSLIKIFSIFLFSITVAANALRSQVQSVGLVKEVKDAVRKKNVDIMENVNGYLELTPWNHVGLGKLFLLSVLNFPIYISFIDSNALYSVN